MSGLTHSVHQLFQLFRCDSPAVIPYRDDQAASLLPDPDSDGTGPNHGLHAMDQGVFNNGLQYVGRYPHIKETFIHIPFNIQPVRVYILIQLQIVLGIFQLFPELAGNIPPLQVSPEELGQHAYQPADLTVPVNLCNPINGLKDIKQEMGVDLGLEFMIAEFQQLVLVLLLYLLIAHDLVHQCLNPA